MHLEDVSFALRVSGCHSGYRNEVLEASVDELGSELRASHAFDLPVVTLEIGGGGGASALRQSFSTRGEAPSRTSPSATAALFAGLRVDIALGLSVFGQSSLVAYLHSQQRTDGTKDLGPHFAFRQELGLAKVW